jgi:outer membrane protein assembly factor BamB
MANKFTSRRGRAIAAFAIGITAVLGATGAVATVRSGATTPPLYTWPEYHNTPDLEGVSPDPGISTANASTLGVKWMTPVTPGIDSPAVAYNATLGETLVYEGGLNGLFNAVDADTGQIVWSVQLGSTVFSSPLVEGNNVWIAAHEKHLYKLNAATGSTECTATVNDGIESTPVIATPPGGTTTIYVGAVGQGTTLHAPVYAINEATCAAQPSFKFKGYPQSGVDIGTWAPFSYAVSATGEGLVLWGSDDPDCAVYAVDAITGKLVWRFQTLAGSDLDVGSGITTSAPGVNGIADGAAYFDGKDGILYAVDLTTGQQIWNWNFGGGSTTTNADTTPALSGTTLVFADTGHVYAVNAVTGVLEWTHNNGTALIDSSPIIVGPAGQQVVAYANINDVFNILSLSSTTAINPSIYSYTTGAFIDGSPADYDGSILISSTDGFLYDFAPGGANGSNPSTVVTSPATGSTIPYPGKTMTITGTATAPDGVSSVTVTLKKSNERWLDSATNTYLVGLTVNHAKLGTPGGTSTTWSITVPVPTTGTTFTVFASAYGANGVADTSAYLNPPGSGGSTFTVQPAP